MKRLSLLAIALAASGCTSDQTMRMDGVTPGAGEAIAANMVMQMVDPWPTGVDDTELLVPAQRAAQAAEAQASGKVTGEDSGRATSSSVVSD
ncbi:MAG: hypothetical protein M9955_19245 [Rhizobiaceae bacterium]|nr:hypothetical protein [Rhizobiaceae bacterium]